MIKLSLAVPCYNEQDNVEAFYNAVKNAFKGRNFTYEIVFVNDGSRDETFSRLKKIYETSDDNITVVSFSRNFGKEAAVLAALDHCRGELISIIDADLQQRPEVVLEMFDYLEAHPDCDCVAAYQEKRIEGKFISFCKKCFYSVVNRICDTKFYPDASDFRTFRRCVAEAITKLPEYHRFSKGLFSWVGFNTHFMPYKVEQRNAGESKWNFGKLLKYAVEGIISFTTAPLKIPVFLGGLLTAAGLIWLIVLAVMSVTGGFTDNIRFALLIAVILDIGGLQLLSVGIIGEYLSRMYVQSKNRPVYIEKCCLTYDSSEKENGKN